MRKTYVQPLLRSSEVQTDNLMTTGSVTGDNGAGWGGVDDTGEKDPDANFNNVWDDSYETTHTNRFFDDADE